MCHDRGLVAGNDVFRWNKAFHQTLLCKKGNNFHPANADILQTRFPNYWAQVVDKGDQDKGDLLRIMHSHKTFSKRGLTMEGENFNQLVLEDRIAVENYFARILSICYIAYLKYKGKEDPFGLIFGFCVGVTNGHTNICPLRS